jgi:hypothetical protein
MIAVIEPRDVLAAAGTSLELPVPMQDLNRSLVLRYLAVFSPHLVKRIPLDPWPNGSDQRGVGSRSPLTCQHGDTHDGPVGPSGIPDQQQHRRRAPPQPADRSVHALQERDHARFSQLTRPVDGSLMPSSLGSASQSRDGTPGPLSAPCVVALI